MLDATSKLQTGILGGNVFDLGNFDECVNIEHQYDDDVILGKFCANAIVLILPYEFHDFDGTIQNLLPIELKNHSNPNYGKFVPLLSSICLPSACKPSDLNPLVEFWNLSEPVSFHDDLCQTKDTWVKLDGYDIFAMYVIFRSFYFFKNL